MIRHLRLLGAALSLLLMAGPQTACDFPEGGRDATTHGFDTTISDARTYSDWPPPLTVEEESGALDPKGGSLDLLHGQVTISIEEGTLEEPITLSVQKRLVPAGDVELVGYIWGPHGMPLDPVARVQVRVPFDNVPPWVLRQDAQLLFSQEDGTWLALTTDVKIDPSELVLTADMPSLGTLAVGPLP